MGRTQEGGSQVNGRGSFHVLYAGPDGGDRVVDALEPYRVTTVTSSNEVREVLSSDVDCLVTTEDLSGKDGIDVLEYVTDAFPTLPVVVVLPSVDSDFLEAIIRANSTDVVWGDGDPSDAGDRLRGRIDEIYEESISDVSETVLETARSLMSAAPDEIDIEIEWGLESIGRQLDADRCVFLEYYEEARALERTHCWSVTGTCPKSEESITATSFPGFEESLSKFSPYAVPDDSSPEGGLEIPEGFVGDLGDLGGDGGDDERPLYLRKRGFEAFLAVPVSLDWELSGVLAVGAREERPWPEAVRRQVRTLGELIGHTLERERRRQELARQNERLDRFASVISHDLQNPINVITGYAELIEETGDIEHLEDIRAAADRMQVMLDDMLTLAREGDILGDLESVALETVVQNAWSSVDTKSATLETRDLEVLEIDPSRFQQVFENLFRNAVEHGGEDVSLLVEATANGFAIEDDGPGIPPEKREEVFEEGYTGGGGTGMGLSIVRAVVEAHGWEVSVTDGTDGGARFEIVTK